MFARQFALDDPARPAIIMAGSGQTITYGELEAEANRVAQHLRACGVGVRDHIAIISENHPRMLMAEAGAERAGVYFTLVNSYLAPDEVAYIVSDCQAKVFYATKAKLDVATQAVAGLDTKPVCVLLDGAPGDAPEGWVTWEEAIAPQPTKPIGDERLGAAMLYSSGTTGRPKGIYRQLPDTTPDESLGVFAITKALWGFREGMVYLNPAPLYHSAPQASVSGALRLGGTVVVMERFDPELWCTLVEEHRVTHCQMVPTMFTRLVKLPEEVRARTDTSSLETIVHAAAPCPVPIKRAMIEWLGPIIVEYYAATEANGFTFVTSEEWLAHPGTVGKAIVGTLEIRDENGGLCPTGVDGTVWFRGATAFEYFNDPGKTAESRDATGEASTVGDVGHVDEDGYLFLTDRKSYMIISGGVNIYPQETENLLASHPKVNDVAVIGVPNDDLGEEVKAVVIADPPDTAGPELEAELIAYCRANLAHFKAPRTIDFVDELPRLPTGKLYKRKLRDQYWAGHSSAIV